MSEGTRATATYLRGAIPHPTRTQTHNTYVLLGHLPLPHGSDLGHPPPPPLPSALRTATITCDFLLPRTDTHCDCDVTYWHHVSDETSRLVATICLFFSYLSVEQPTFGLRSVKRPALLGYFWGNKTTAGGQDFLLICRPDRQAIGQKKVQIRSKPILFPATNQQLTGPGQLLICGPGINC